MKEENWTYNHVPQSQPQKDHIHPCSTANLLYLGGGPVKKEKKVLKTWLGDTQIIEPTLKLIAC